jgi:hypothetical protein
MGNDGTATRFLKLGRESDEWPVALRPGEVEPAGRLDGPTVVAQNVDGVYQLKDRTLSRAAMNSVMNTLTQKTRGTFWTSWRLSAFHGVSELMTVILRNLSWHANSWRYKLKLTKHFQKNPLASHSVPEFIFNSVQFIGFNLNYKYKLVWDRLIPGFTLYTSKVMYACGFHGSEKQIFN